MGHITFWHFILRILVLYLLVMVALRVMGKREIGQLSVFDFVVSVMVAELSTLPMEDTNVTLWRSVVSIAMLVVLQVIVAFGQLKSHRFRHWVDGEPSVLIEHGSIQDAEMKKTRYTMHDLLMQLREKGVANVADVEFAILETSGKLSVFPKAEKRPVTPEDLGRAVRHDSVPLPLIVDGVPVQKTLDILGQPVEWLEGELKRRGYGPTHQVFYAAIDETGQIHLDPRDASVGQRWQGAAQQAQRGDAAGAAHIHNANVSQSEQKSGDRRPDGHQ
ncbi:DUF421 domain-containing protein [Alicyclobacillus sp. ALC3]|uniref:DUF421 domain-containing protein n=1 Tax=Alicyclobacillus sp. ALC3 TaxID=2796143 RepID=UPI0023787D7A|nr:DUF421 domain-containing protein [Alicyclobacillus sp. ALC3]